MSKISLKKFIDDNVGKYISFKDSEKVPQECVTLIQEYIRQCYGIPFKARGNAKDWIKASNHSDIADIVNKGQYGDIIIWDGNYGHVAIYIDGKKYFDQYKGKKSGYSTNSTNGKILGYLRMKGTRPKDEASSDHRFNLTRLLKKGVSGNDVKELQKELTALGWRDANLKKLTIDGIFGTNTEVALKKMQAKRKIAADGIVGKNTAKALGWLYQGK